ncbi:hypothetical protein HPB48_002404 [Haemaphysalis longicornis]|uniref:Uncharacterized protein n=1 Tax=Haemaphysalis longicornis TaxID=44386 RepID=A0A9J6F9X5_HAELO|nr:hypothetical protein HPB48_002404 [Haemaphysalis longicornis]
MCQRKELGADVRYIDHALHELPARRVFAADGLHASFEGVALLAEHFRNALSFRALGWQRRPFKPRAPNNPTPGATPAQRERQRAPPSPEVSPTTAVTPKTSPRRPNGNARPPLRRLTRGFATTDSAQVKVRPERHDPGRAPSSLFAKA